MNNSLGLEVQLQQKIEDSNSKYWNYESLITFNLLFCLLKRIYSISNKYFCLILK